MSEGISLKSLVGEHLLSGVSDLSVSVNRYGFDDTANQIVFILDGTAYAATEDPGDGYRSYLGSLEACDPSVVTNTFPPQRVIASHRTRNESGYATKDSADVLEFRDAVTGRIVLEVGEDNTDDYYPWFVGKFWPDNMAINQKEQS